MCVYEVGRRRRPGLYENQSLFASVRLLCLSPPTAAQTRLGVTPSSSQRWMARFTSGLVVRFTNKTNGEFPSQTAIYFLFYRRCFFSLGSQISEAPRPIAAKLYHMIAIWWQSLAKVGQLGGPPLKNFRGQKYAKFRSIFCNVRL